MYRVKKATTALAALGTLFCAVLLSLPVPTAGAATASSPTSPLSVTFVSSGEGWSLTTTKCGTGARVRLERTENGGKSWSDVAMPAALQTWVDVYSSLSDFPQNQPDVFFANSADGWIYGTNNVPGSSYPSNAELWATHNGGRTWSPIATSTLGMKYDVLTMSASKGWAYAVGWHTDDTFGLWRVPVASNTWQRVATPTLYQAAGGSAMQGALVFRGDGGWLMVGNDRGATGLARMTASGTWVKWNGPCGPVGDSYAVPVASSSTDLLDVCTIGGYGGDVAKGTPSKLKMNTDWLFTSNDGGLKFSPLREVGAGYTTQWLGGVAGAPTSTSQGLIFVEKLVQSGQSSVQHLEISRNEARSWQTVYSVKSNVFNSFFGPVSFTSMGLGSDIFLTSRETSSLLISTDGGQRWIRSDTNAVSRSSHLSA
jgi:hypothetical protein